MFEELGKYKFWGRFTFKPNESLSEKCTAPNDKSGVYLVYAIYKWIKELVYIGSSGKKQPDGSLRTLKDGMNGRLVKGHQFDKKPRRHTWPIQMRKEFIYSLTINFM